MNDKLRTEIRVGVTVILGIAVLLFGFSWFKEWTMTGGFYTLKMRFDNSSGLQNGDPVMINGVRAGKVTLVKVESNTVLVRFPQRLTRPGSHAATGISTRVLPRSSAKCVWATWAWNAKCCCRR